MQSEKHKKAKEKLIEIDKKRDICLIIHYSCESFYDVKDGHSPRITSIAVSHLDTGQTDSFSIHMTAEKMLITTQNLEQEYDKIERKMLDDFFEYVNQHTSYLWIHWNMRDANYGFPAIEHRYRVLGGNPSIIANSNKIDFSRLLNDYYGKNYIAHPKMVNLMKKNKITDKDFLNGADEALAFQKKEYVKLHQSTLRKVNIFADFLDLTLNKQLKNDSKWYEKYGYSPQGIYEYCTQTWWIQIIIALLNLFLGAYIGKMFL